MELRPLQEKDLVAAAPLHAAAFPGFFLSSLGPRVLAEFYRAHVLLNDAFAVVAEDPATQHLLGVVAGTTAPSSFYRDLARRNPAGAASAAAGALLRRPRSVARLAAGLRHGSPVPFDVTEAALLSSICVSPQARGLGVGTALMNRWTLEAADRGAPAAYLTTDAVDNGAVREWYEHLGWESRATFVRRDGRPLACYYRRLPLAGTPSA